MIDKELLKKTVEDAIAGTEVFLVDIQISADNEIVVEIDSMQSVDIDTCVMLTHKIEDVFDRDKEDYSLEVGSAGITAPFKVLGQYTKNIGNNVEVLTGSGSKLHGMLTAVDGDTFTIEVPTKVKEPGKKRPTMQPVPQTLKMNEIKYIKQEL